VLYYRMALNEQGEWVDWQNTKVLQKAAVVDGAGNVLILTRVAEGKGGRLGKADLCGGSLGPDDLTDANPHAVGIAREVLEETGLEITSITPVFVDSWVFERSVGQVLGIAIGYIALVAGVMPAVTLGNEHSAHAWVSRDEALQADFGDDGGMHKAILERLP
jgi:8-oxo-dGTP pyrophosphatase MutT (NUDIX family)